jgi:hypothetical protein
VLAGHRPAKPSINTRRAAIAEMIVESTPLALLPLIFAILILAARFYIRENAISVLSPSFVFATIGVLLLLGYMLLVVLELLPPYAWVGFGGMGVLMAVLGIWSFYR